MYKPFVLLLHSLYLSTKLCCVILYKTIFLMFTAIKTSNLTYFSLFHLKIHNKDGAYLQYLFLPGMCYARQS